MNNSSLLVTLRVRYYICTQKREMNRRKFFKQAGISALAVAMGGNVLPAQGEELFYNHPNVNNNMNKRMKHKCKITILKRECYKDLQAEYLADPKSGPCCTEHSVPKHGIASADTSMRHCRAAPSCRAGRTTKR